MTAAAPWVSLVAGVRLDRAAPDMPLPTLRRVQQAATPRRRALRLIALYKFVKTAGCVLLAAAAFHLVQPPVAAQFGQWLESLTWATRLGVVARLIGQVVAFGPRQFRLLGFTALLYMLLYAVQGLGLWFGQRWAAYLVILESGLLLPFELWALRHRFSSIKLAVLVVNVLVVVYLVHALRHRAAGSSEGL